MQTKHEVLQACTVEGMIVKLPPVQLDRKLYQDVAKSLELIGGKWKGNKIMGFVFPLCPKDLLQQISNGEKRNLKKEFQFFGTPAAIADRLVTLAGIQTGDNVLEPSAGQGAILEAIQRTYTPHRMTAIELMTVNCSILRSKGKAVIEGDFLIECKDLYNSFDKVIANPPFSGNQDIDHIVKMYLCCKFGGRIVTIASKHWQYATENKCKQFREWLTEINAEIIEVPAGEFKESGTSIATCIIIINK